MPDDYQTSFALLRDEVKSQGDDIRAMRRQVESLVTEVAIISNDIRQLDVRVAKPSFWDGQHAGIALRLIGLLVFGLLALAGLNLASMGGLL